MFPIPTKVIYFPRKENRVPYFIEEVCNENRLHSELGYCPPNEYESLVARKGNTPW